MRLLVAFATAAAAVSLSAPAEAATAVYGFAWADGKGHLRLVPKSATRASKTFYTFKALPKGKELRLDYTRAAYGRVTVACDLVETEGRIAVDAKGLGRTKCGPGDLTDTLARGPQPVRVEYRGGKATRVNEVLISGWGTPRTATGTIKRVNDTTVLFTTGGQDDQARLHVHDDLLPHHREVRRRLAGRQAGQRRQERPGQEAVHLDGPDEGAQGQPAPGAGEGRLHAAGRLAERGVGGLRRRLKRPAGGFSG
ncbi:hypothetical protein GCM10020220_067910 [Nonomuraea rubra]|uniref:hypothetical protein n=1 Tax=Nonomuraea rubra TaxID=46180 RepID=UPI0031E57A82